MKTQARSPTCPKRCSKSQRRGLLVRSAPKKGVDSKKMIVMANATGHHACIQYARPRLLLDMVVGRLASDNHVVHMALAQACAGDAHKLGVLLQFFDRAATQVAHARAQAAHQLKDHRLERSAIGL